MVNSFRKARKELDRSIQSLKRGTGSALLNLGRIAKNTARVVAPRSSGKTMRNIVLRKKGVRGIEVVAQNPTYGDEATNPYRDSAFNLVRWMHQDKVRGAGYYNPNVSRPEEHIYSGDPKFMFRAQESVEKKARDVTVNELRDKVNILN
jgi:hypothetical protein